MALKSKEPECNICGKLMPFLFKKRILNKYKISYFKCKSCFIIQTEKPYWLKESYNEPIFDADVGLLSRNILFSKILTTLIFYLFDSNKKHLDYSGGYGVFSRLMRDAGFDYYWDDPFSKNLFSRGFEKKNGEKYQVVTAFEYMEHIAKPIDEVANIFNRFGCESFIFSTTLRREPLDKDWWYFMYESGQHISFYSIVTLRKIAEKENLYLSTNGRNLHMLSKKPFNNALFYALTYGFYITNIFTKFSLKSKTISDHETIRKLQK